MTNQRRILQYINYNITCRSPKVQAKYRIYFWYSHPIPPTSKPTLAKAINPSPRAENGGQPVFCGRSFFLWTLYVFDPPILYGDYLEQRGKGHCKGTMWAGGEVGEAVCGGMTREAERRERTQVAP